MAIDFSSISPSQVIWAVLIVLGLILAYVVIRFFWQHILRYLFHGCLVIVAIVLVLALLQYFQIIHIPWPF